MAVTSWSGPQLSEAADDKPHFSLPTESLGLANSPTTGTPAFRKPKWTLTKCITIFMLLLKHLCRLDGHLLFGMHNMHLQISQPTRTTETSQLHLLPQVTCNRSTCWKVPFSSVHCKGNWQSDAWWNNSLGFSRATESCSYQS